MEFETGDTTKSDSINMKEKCLVEETSFDYGEGGALVERDPNQTLTSSKVKTKKALGKPLSKINFSFNDVDDDILLDVPLKLLSPLKNLVNISVYKSFALDIGLDKMVGKSSQKKLQVVKRLFSKINGFGEVFTSSKFVGIIRALFTFESSLAQALKKAEKAKILVNIDLKKSTSCSDWAVVVKKIPVETFAEAVHAALSEFDTIKVIKANIDKELWDTKDQHKALLYILPIGTNAHDIWDFIGSTRCAIICFNFAASIDAVMETTFVLKGANLHWSYLISAKYAKYENLGYTSLDCSVNGKTSPGGPTHRILLNDDKNRLAFIYARCSAPIFCPVSFGGILWANIVGEFLFSPLSVCNGSASSGSSSEMKPTPVVSMKLNNRLAKRLDSSGPMVSQPSPKWADIMMSESSGVVTGSETIAGVAVCESSVVSKMEKTLRNLSITVMSLSAKIDNTGLFATCNVWGLNVPAKQEDVVCWHKESNNMISIITEMKLRFDEVCIFTFGLDNGFFEAGMAIIMDNLLVRHVSKVEEIPDCAILVHLLFKDKISVLIVGLYVCASSGNWFRQVPCINFFIAQVVNSSSFVVLGGDFNESKSIRNASFGFCLSLGLVNFFGGHSLADALTWSNSRGAKKVIDHIFVSESLISATAGHRVKSVTEFFDTDYRAVLVSVGLGGFLDKFKLKNVNTDNWECFMKCFSTKFLERSVVLYDVKCSDVMIDFANVIFSRLWFSKFDSTRNKTSLKFHGLEMLMSKIVNSIKTGLSSETDCFVDTWMGLDDNRASKIWVIINKGTKIENIVRHISVVKKEYHRSKYHESRIAKNESIKMAVAKRIENFCSDKGRIIKSILDWPFRKVVLNHLIAVKSSVDTIIKSWTKKHLVLSVLPGQWLDQYTPLDYVNNDVFSKVMCDISLDKLLVIVKELSDGKAHSGSLALNGLLSILNRCLKSGNILSKILSDRISLACSKYNILHDNNFSVLKSTSTQSLIFAVGLIVENALEKNRELWIKMCLHFISFFGGIYNRRFNQIMIDFGLFDSYIVHDGLDQRKMFSSLLWRIFYNPLLCKVKKHEQLYDYRMCLKFYTKSGKANPNSNSISFFVAGAFVDNTIWIENCLMTMQNILNIVSEFFSINNILINANKTVTIPINQGVWDAELSISGLRISMAKRGESHHYLGIFLSTKRLSKPSLTKAHADIRFFSNVVLRKAITKKQFLYLVSAVLQPIPFEQVLTESLMANLVNFSNAGGTLSRFFEHRAMDLQMASWMSQYPFCFLVMLFISSLNCFLAGTTLALALCNTSLNGALPNVFRAGSSVPILNVLGVSGYLVVKNSLRRYGLVFADQLGSIPAWFVLVSNFVKFGGLSNNMVVAFCSASVNVVWDTGFVSEQLLATGHGSINVYIDGSVKGLGSIGACSGAAAYFPKANTSIGIRIFRLLFSILVELQVIALALECIFESSTTSLDICKFDIGSCGLNFQCKCWIEKEHICHVISNKNLAVTWKKVKEHLGVIKNKCVDFFVNATTLFKSVLPLSMPCHFFSVKNKPVSKNVCYFVRKLFDAVNFVSWEFKFGTSIVDVNFTNNIDLSKSFSVWHPNGKICSDYTSSSSAFLWFYLMKFIHCHLSIATRKRLYDPKYPSVVCIKYGMIENSDHLFLYKHDDTARLDILSNIGIKWYKMAGDFTLGSGVMQSLSKAKSSDGLYMLLAKGFVLKSWVSDVILCLGLTFGDSLIVRLVRNIAKSHKSNIWLFAAKLRAFYKKCNLLLQDRSAVLSVGGLLSLWFQVGCSLCFDLYPCLASLGFGFLGSISLTDPVCA
ncbi:hypothetical protein G9A89_009751 [Geosiphon pyriformis]|nr:hypothetical protein G9A89_009751 [Geosiphon pyriformis]